MIGQKGFPAHSGGIERHVDALSRRLVAQGHDVFVFCRSWYCQNIPMETNGVTRVFLPTLHTKHLDAIAHTFFSILSATRRKVDVYHFHGVGPALLSWLPRLLRPTAKVVVTFHCIDRHHQKWGVIARFMLHLGEWMSCRMPDATIAVSRGLQEYCHLAYGERTVYIPNGVQVPDTGALASDLQPFGLEPNQYVLMCARLVKHKGAHTLIEAWKTLKRESPEIVGDKKLAIVGGSACTDAYVAELAQLAADEPSIVLTGPQTGAALHALFAHALYAVHPSLSEGLPIAVLEAMSYGKTVLASDIPENKEVLGTHGRLFHVDDQADLVCELTKLLQASPEQLRALGQQARGHVARHYDWNDIAQTTSYLYEMLWAEEPEFKQA